MLARQAMEIGLGGGNLLVMENVIEIPNVKLHR